MKETFKQQLENELDLLNKQIEEHEIYLLKIKILQAKERLSELASQTNQNRFNTISDGIKVKVNIPTTTEALLVRNAEIVNNRVDNPEKVKIPAQEEHNDLYGEVTEETNSSIAYIAAQNLVKSLISIEEENLSKEN